MDDMHKSFKYERPHLLDLFDTSAVGFSCSAGGGYGSECNPYGAGASSGGGCITGGYAGSVCSYGATALPGNCGNGSGASTGTCVTTGSGAGLGCYNGAST
jgi:hypothetical protein